MNPEKDRRMNTARYHSDEPTPHNRITPSWNRLSPTQPSTLVRNQVFEQARQEDQEAPQTESNQEQSKQDPYYQTYQPNNSPQTTVPPTPSSLSEEEELTMELMEGFSDDFVPQDRIIDTPTRQFWDLMQQRADYVLSMHKTVEAERQALKNKQRLTELPTHNPVALTRLRILGDEVDPYTYEQILDMPPVPRQNELHEKTVDKKTKPESELGSHKISLQKEIEETQPNSLNAKTQSNSDLLDSNDDTSSEDQTDMTEGSYAYMKPTPDASDAPPLPIPTAELRKREASETKEKHIDESPTESAEPIVSYATPKEKVEQLITETKEPIAYPSSIRDDGKHAYKRKYIESSVGVYDTYRTNSHHGSRASQQQRKAATLERARQKFEMLSPITAQGDKGFERDLFLSAITHIKLSPDQDFIPFDRDRHDILKMRWHELKVNPRLAFNFVYDTKDNFSDGRNAVAQMRVRILYRKLGEKKAQEILDMDEPQRSQLIWHETKGHSLEKTPVRLNHTGLEYGTHYTVEGGNNIVHKINLNNHLRNSSELIVQSKKGSSPVYYSFFTGNSKNPVSIETPIGQGSMDTKYLPRKEKRLEWSDVQSLHGGDTDRGFPRLVDENNQTIQEKMSLEDSIVAFYKIMFYGYEGLYHELNHASTLTSSKRELNSDIEYTQMPGVPEKAHISDINETLNSLKSLKEFAYKELEIDILTADDVLEFYQNFWVNAGVDKRGNLNKTKIPLNVRILMNAIDHMENESKKYDAAILALSSDRYFKENFEEIRKLNPNIRDIDDFLNAAREANGTFHSIYGNEGKEAADEYLKSLGPVTSGYYSLVWNNSNLINVSPKKLFLDTLKYDNMVKQASLENEYSGSRRGDNLA